MKRLIAICLAAVLALGLAACGEQKEGSSAPAEMDMKSVYAKLGRAVELPEMLELDADLMLDYCGIRQEDVSQAIVMICADSLRTDEIWLIEARDETAAKSIMELANKRLEKKGEESITYSPEQYAVVEKAELLQQGRFIALLVSPDAGDMAKVFRQEAGL